MPWLDPHEADIAGDAARQIHLRDGLVERDVQTKRQSVKRFLALLLGPRCLPQGAVGNRCTRKSPVAHRDIVVSASASGAIQPTSP